jgi:Tol biopolymer transport system component
MLTSRTAFGAKTVSDTLVAVLQQEPDWSALPRSTPSAVGSLLRRCLQKDRKHRLRDIGDARIELEVAWPREDERERSTRSIPRLGALGLALVVASIAATVGVETLLDRRASTGEPSPPRRVMTRATADAGVTAEPALSDDGTLLAYASDRAGTDNLDIWVQQTAGSTPLQLTHDPVDEHEPAFSPDGSRLAYRSERDGGGIYIVPALGGQEPRLIVSGGRRPRFSPDGRLLAYWTGSNVGFADNAGSYRTFVIPADGGTAREIEGFSGARYPVWAPDGRSLLLLASRDPHPLAGTYDWFRVPIDGAAPISLRVGALVQGAGIGFDSGAVFPDDWRGDQVLFSDGSYLWSMQLNPEATVASNVERLTFGTNREIQGASAASGTIAFASTSVVSSVWALPIDTVRGTATGVPSRVTPGAGLDGRPSASRDGQLVAYRSTSPRPSIFVKNRTTQSIIDVGAAGSGFGPAISPDGAYVAYEDGGGVRVVSTRGGTPRTLCQPCLIGDWWADNRGIIVVKDENNAGRLTGIRLSDGQQQDLIVSSNQTVNRPFPSPDGRLLAFRRMNVEGGAIMLAPLTREQPVPSGAWIELVAPETDARPAGWSPDGALLFFVSGRDGVRCLYAQRVDRTSGARMGEPFVVRHFHGPRNVYRVGLNVLSTGPANAIAGGFFFYDISDLSANIWTMRRR